MRSMQVAKKRQGEGGNSSRDPRGNLSAQQAYTQKFGSRTKACTGMLHFGGPEVEVAHFRQAKGNRSSFLQSRCDLCNRLYFSIQQKPIKRIAAAVIYLARSRPSYWIDSVPTSLRDAVTTAVSAEANRLCEIAYCTGAMPHGDYRATAAVLTGELTGVDRRPRTSFVTDSRTGERFAASVALHDLQTWAGSEGHLWLELPTSEIWEWWLQRFPRDSAYCSREERESRENAEFELVPHPLKDFSWGAGNIKDTVRGHSVPAFNQVKASASLLPPSGSAHGRAYGFLCEGDHLAMIRLSEKFKSKKLSLGHTPAPLRWLGKNDPVNAKGELLAENVRKRDSLAELHQAALENPEHAGQYVSWQVRPLVVSLGRSGGTFESFTQSVEAAVEEYFDGLTESLRLGSEERALEDLRRACPGLTETVYLYRLGKVREWLTGRPAYRASSDS